MLVEVHFDALPLDPFVTDLHLAQDDAVFDGAQLFRALFEQGWVMVASDGGGAGKQGLHAVDTVGGIINLDLFRQPCLNYKLSTIAGHAEEMKVCAALLAAR